MKKPLFFIISAALMLNMAACTATPSAEGAVEEDFKAHAVAFAESFLSQDYEVAIEMPYFQPGHEHLRESYRQLLTLSGEFELVEYRIDAVNKLSDSLYQLDGLLTYTGGYTERFIPFYFLMDGEWHYALNEYEVPRGYLEGLEYLTFDDLLDPDAIEIYSFE